MAGNTTAITEVVDPVAIEQFNQLKASGKELRAELVVLLETAIKLNATLGGSTPATFNKNLQASTDATNKIIANNNKQIENEQAKAAKQEQILNKYLVMLSKQEAARQQAEAKQAQRDAKEIAAQNKKVDASKKEQAQNDKEAAAFVASEAKKNEALAKSNRAYNLAVKARDDARKNAKDIGIALGVESQAFKDAAENANNLAAKVEKVNTPLGDFKDKVGGYARDISSVFSKTFGYIRTLANILPNFGIGTFFLFAAQGLQILVEQLTQGGFALDSFQRTLDALNEAFKDSSFKDAISNVIDLKEQFKLAKDGIVDQDIVLAKYNSTIGQTIGQTTDLDTAEKLLVQHSPAFIRSMLYKAAAAAALASGAEDLAKATQNVLKGEGNQKQTENDIAGLQRIIKTSRDKNEVEQAKSLLKMGQALKKSDDDELKERQDYADKLLSQTTKIYDRLSTLSNSFKVGFLSADEQKAQEDRNKTAFAYNKGLIQDDLDKNEAIVANEKKSYNERYSALKKTLSDQTEIIKISESEEMDNASLTKAEIQAIEDKAAFDKLKAQRDYTKKLQDLKDAQYKQDQEILKNNIQAQIDIFKQIIDNPLQSGDIKLASLDIFNKKSKELINANYDEQVKAAGKNKESLKLAGQEYDKAILNLDTKASEDRLKIHKETLQKLLELSKESEQEQVDILNQGAIVAAQRLNDNRDKLINAKQLEYAKGKLTEKQFNRDLLAINDEYNVQRIAQELAVQQSILAIREGQRDASLLAVKGRNATPEELAKIASDSNKGITPVNNKIGDLSNQLGNAKTKQATDLLNNKTADTEENKKALQEALGYAKDITADINDLIDKGYENQISKLEKIGEKIQENADIEKAAIDRSLDTQSNKARREEVLAAETASKQKAIQQEIAKEKHKQAVADKVAAIAEIILNTAIAASKVVAQTGILGLLTGVPAVIALGAIQLAKVAATPIPQFAKGTPSGGHKGGPAIVGEVGPERITEPGRPAYYSPGVATMMSLPRGTVVEPYKMLPETPKWTVSRSDNSAVVDGLSRVERAVSGQKRGNTQLSGWVQAQRQADAWNGYVQSKFK